MPEVGRVSTSSFVKAPVAKNLGSEAQSKVKHGATALESSLKSRASKRNEGMDPAGMPEEKVRQSESALDSLLEFRNAIRDKRQDADYLPEPEPKNRSGPSALESLLEHRNANKHESTDPAGEEEAEVRNGATALDAYLEFRHSTRDERQDPGYLPELEPKDRSGASALKSLQEHRAAKMHESMDPAGEEEAEVRNGATALDGYLAFREDNRDKRLDTDYIPEAKARNGGKALDAILQLGNDQLKKIMDPEDLPEPEAKSRVGATALDSALNAQDLETGTFGTNEKGIRDNLDLALEEGDRKHRKVPNGTAGRAVAIVQDSKETAKHVQEKMAELEQFLAKVLEEAPVEGRVETEFKNQLQQLMDAINQETTHTLLGESPLLGEGGQDLKIALGDGTFDVVSAENFSVSLEGADPESGQGLASLLSHVRGRMSAIKDVQRRMEDQLERLAHSNNQIAGEIARDMGVDPTELDPESAAQLASHVASQMVGMTTVMMNLDLDHQAKRIAGLLRSPI